MYEHRNTGLGHYGYREIFNGAAAPTMLDTAARKAARAALGIAEDAAPIEWFRVSGPKTTNAAGGKAKTTAEILIYDIIDPWGVSAGDFANTLNALDADEIVVGINSPGGIVFDGIAIMNALKRHPANIITRIDGLAASAASFIAMAGDEIQTSKHAEMMIHEARGYVSGTAEDMKEMLDLLVRHNQTIAGVYQDRAGGDLKDWLKLMKNETWFTADEMVAQGLADTIIEADDESSEADETESLKNQFDLSVFNYAGRQAAPPPPARNQLRRTATNDQRKAATMGLKEQLAETYGLDPDLGDDEFAAAVEAAKVESSDGAGDSSGGAAPAGTDSAPTAAQMAAFAEKHNVSFIANDVLAQLKNGAAAGEQALAAQAAAANAQTINEALASGRITAASAERWTEALNKNPEETRELLALIPQNSAVPVAEIGHCLVPDGAAVALADDPNYKAWSF